MVQRSPSPGEREREDTVHRRAGCEALRRAASPYPAVSGRKRHWVFKLTIDDLSFGTAPQHQPIFSSPVMLEAQGGAKDRLARLTTDGFVE